ncbi:hypothetical protein [Candidatus Babela massiliensis]|uniref:Replication-associated protein n=1 Tax=Candidatus Babela massiliensis TaxID=673862 RepID=V6DIC7_9BACT|nr:hypothetical protein [Candidatus Babela massiliensis]CDK30281.1 replication-associated protein [Candidatus Babela massiliensis]
MKTLKYLLSLALIVAVSQAQGQENDLLLEGNYTFKEEGNKATITKTLPNGGFERARGDVIDIKNNKVGIEENDVCAVVTPAKSSSLKGDVILCKSGKVIKIVCKKEGSSTGTPPWLDKDKQNYIGSRTKESTSGLVGSKRRESYYMDASDARGECLGK